VRDCILVMSKAAGEELIRFLCRPRLLIVDEIGYLPVVAGGGNLFFQLVNAQYERGAMTLTSNRGFVEWGDVLAIPSSPPHCSTDSFTTPSSFKSKDQATAHDNMRNRCQSTSAPKPRRRRRSLVGRRSLRP